MKIINMAAAITLFAASYTHASSLPDEGSNSIADAVGGIQAAISAAQAVNDQALANAVDSALDLLVEWGDLTPSLTDGHCGSTCSECRMSEFKKGFKLENPRCKDSRTMQYGDQCTDEQLAEEGKNLCQTGGEQLCHMSWPAGDWKKSHSDEAACRSVPSDYIDGEYSFLPLPVLTESDKGLCTYGCEDEGNDEKCAFSWPVGANILHAQAMFRCLPTDAFVDGL